MSIRLPPASGTVSGRKSPRTVPVLKLLSLPPLLSTPALTPPFLIVARSTPVVFSTNTAVLTATCPSSCTYTEYTLSTSYSAFPAKYLVEPLISQIEPLFRNTTSNSTEEEFIAADIEPSLNGLYHIYENVTINQEFLENNILSINIYCEALNLKKRRQKMHTASLLCCLTLVASLGYSLVPV